MGLRCEKAVATHLLLENAYESNLLSDISKVDYLGGNLGRTNLRPLEGLPAFVDDIFVFGYLSREECVFQKGKLSCTSGEKGAAKLVGSIANALERALGKRGYMQTALVHTVATGDARGSTIRATIARIERDTLHKANRKWKEEIAGYFVAKCDVSEVPLEEMHSGLHVFEKFLEGYGYGIYSIDYTQDFSGVLDREALVGKLGFRKAGDFCTAIDEKELTILENTNTVGEHVCTWISTTAEGRTARTKIYNKVVSNSRQEKSANLLAAIWQTTSTAPTHTSAKPSYTRTCKPEGARASKSLCTHAHKTNFRARKPQTTSRKSWSKFPRKTRRTASSWSNPSANSGKTSPKA